MIQITIIRDWLLMKVRYVRGTHLGANSYRKHDNSNNCEVNDVITGDLR